MKPCKNLTMVLVTLLLLYIVVEACAFQLFSRLLPPLAYPLLDDGVPILLQNSKASTTPTHYIALAGDSYAMGLGDQYYHEAGRARANYGSAALIHSNTGKDVISFGSAGNGSIAGMVTEPLSTLAYWRASSRITLNDPETLLVYFYEGNDLNDNVEYLQRASKKRLTFDYAQLNNSSYFQHYIQEVALNQDSLYQHAQNLHWYDELYLGKFILRSSAGLFVQLTQVISNTTDNSSSNTATASPDSHRSPLNPPGRFAWIEPGSINHALIDGQDVQLPDSLQGPSMDLTNQEKDIALVSFHEALLFLKQQLPKTTIVVVYVPSVISCYNISSRQVSLQSHAQRKQFVFDTKSVQQQSDWIKQHIEQISAETKVAFVDAHPAILTASKTRQLHGPLDWNHFNQQGYAILAQAITPALQQPAASR